MIGDWELPRVEHISVLEGRRVAALPVPGLRGDLQQDLGTHSLTVEIRGSLHGDEARDTFLEAVRESFNAGDPVSFVADIVTATELEEVLILRLDLEEVNDWAEGFRYRIVLREYVEPPEPASAFDDLGADLDAELDDLAGLGLDGLELPDLLIDVPSLGNPVEPIKPALEGVRAATGGIGDLLGELTAKFDGGDGGGGGGGGGGT